MGGGGDVDDRERGRRAARAGEPRTAPSNVFIDAWEEGYDDEVADADGERRPGDGEGGPTFAERDAAFRSVLAAPAHGGVPTDLDAATTKARSALHAREAAEDDLYDQLARGAGEPKADRIEDLSAVEAAAATFAKATASIRIEVRGGAVASRDVLDAIGVLTKAAPALLAEVVALRTEVPVARARETQARAAIYRIMQACGVQSEATPERLVDLDPVVCGEVAAKNIEDAWRMTREARAEVARLEGKLAGFVGHASCCLLHDITKGDGA